MQLNWCGAAQKLGLTEATERVAQILERMKATQ